MTGLPSADEPAAKTWHPGEVMSYREQATEIELDAGEDCLRRMLVNLIKAGLASTDEAAAGWKSEAVKLHEELRSRFSFLKDDDGKLDRIWNQAREEAQRDSVVQTEESVKPVLQSRCVFTLRELMTSDLSVEAAAAWIRVSAATG
jgi:hypothetical protein